MRFSAPTGSDFDLELERTDAIPRCAAFSFSFVSLRLADSAITSRDCRIEKPESVEVWKAKAASALERN